MESLVGKSLNRYKILELLGQGGIGEVYRALDSVLQREVAIKVMLPEFASQPDLREPFLAEARTAARLDHPSIVQVHDFGASGTYLYIVMEFIPGEVLRKTLQDLRAHNQWVILNEAVLIVIEVCQALDYALKHGVLHRDIKPDNLMLKPESATEFDAGRGLTYRVVITDLGLARLTSEKHEGDSRGTPAYMSPEQTLGHQTDARSDVYSLGVLLYELCVGRLPFPATTLEEAVRYHTREPVPAPRTIRPDLPISLEGLIIKALEKNSANRFADAGEMGRALDEIIPQLTGIDTGPKDLSDTVSLLTQYDETHAESTQPMEPAYDLRQDFIEALLPDHSTRSIQMLPRGLTIGRDRDNDVVLDTPKISRHHARIEVNNGAYWVSDLNSLNGTYVGGTRLSNEVPEAWAPEKVLQVGDVYLRLRKTGLPTATIPGSPFEIDSAKAKTVAEGVSLRETTSTSGPAGVFMETVQLSVTPGATTTASMIVINQGPIVDRFKVAVSGLPPNWIPAPPPSLQLPPGSQQEVKLTIHPPLSPQTRPGRYPITVQVFSQAAPTQVAEVKVTLTVGVFTRFTCELQPRRLFADQSTHVTVQNHGNARESYLVQPMDRMEELSFDPPQVRMALSEGESAVAEFRILPRHRRWIGADKLIPFSTQVTMPSGESQTLTGELVNPGILPVWILPVMLVLCLCLALAAAYGYINIFAIPANAARVELTQTQSAYMTEVALAIIDQGTYVVATDRAATRTAQALLATATAPTSTSTPTGTPTLATPTVSNTPSPTWTPVIVVVTATTAPSATPVPTNTPIAPAATPRGGSPLIAFDTNRDGNYEVYAMLTDGTHQTRITNNPGQDTRPVWSPDRTHLAFVSTRDGHPQIYSMNSDGSGQARISNNNFNDTGPAWSPDGSKIAFSSDRGGHPQIYVMNADGSNQTPLISEPSDDDHPAWSPDGSKIAFDSGPDNQKDIFTVSPNGSNKQQLTNNGAINREPDYSLDGSQITYVSNQSGSAEVFIMNANGSGQMRITTLGTTIERPTWSKDGKWIAFKATANLVGQIFIVSSDGAQIYNLSQNGSDNGGPTW